MSRIDLRTAEERMKAARDRLTVAAGWVQAMARVAAGDDADVDSELPAFSRRAFVEQLELARMRGVRACCGVVRLPGAGPALLREVCHLLYENTRRSDIIARVDADVFGLILHQAPTGGGRCALRRLDSLLRGILPGDEADVIALRELRHAVLPVRAAATAGALLAELLAMLHRPA